MASPIRFIQITDLHIPSAGEKPRNLDIRTNFLRLLDKAKSHHPEFLVLTGDLCFKDGQPEIYDWIKKQLDQTGLPYWLIPGNHDDSVMLAQQFGLEHYLRAGTLFFEQELQNGTKMLFLDTARKELSDVQMEWLANRLSIYSGPVLLFIHHPVLPAGTPFMDETHALANQDQVASILMEYPENVYLYSGHFHIDKVVIRKNLIQHITPSCFLQISQWAHEFEVDHYRIGFREIILNEQEIMSTVVYI